MASGEEEVALKVRRRVGLGPAREGASALPCRRNVIRGGREIAQLLIGTEAPEEVMEAACMEVTGDAAELARVLFPAQQPQLSQLDRF